MLKELDIFVRSHLSPLQPEQVALMRARWEREKRKQKETPAPPKRRRAVKAVEPVAATPEARPKRRRRTAAEVAAADAEAQAEAAVEAERELKAREALEAAKAVDDEAKPSLEERAAALFKELPAADDAHPEPFAPSPFAAPTGAAAPGMTASPSPRSVIPTPVRPKPEATRREGAREDAGAGDGVHHRLRARQQSQGPRQGDRRVRLQGARADGDDQPAARLRHDRADRVGVRLPGGARGGVRGRGAGRGGGRGGGRAQAPLAGGDRHGPRRPRQDVPARLRPQGQCGGGRGGGDYAAPRGLPREA